MKTVRVSYGCETCRAPFDVEQRVDAEGIADPWQHECPPCAARTAAVSAGVLAAAFE